MENWFELEEWHLGFLASEFRRLFSHKTISSEEMQFLKPLRPRWKLTHLCRGIEAPRKTQKPQKRLSRKQPMTDGCSLSSWGFPRWMLLEGTYSLAVVELSSPLILIFILESLLWLIFHIHFGTKWLYWILHESELEMCYLFLSVDFYWIYQHWKKRLFFLLVVLSTLHIYVTELWVSFGND